MTNRILMIEDDEKLSSMVTEYLSGFGMDVTAVPSAEQGRLRLKTEDFDALLLDVMLPDADGLSLCREFRAASDIPILMLTARGEDTDRIVGLELGADDYLPKPFNPRELSARLRAILRRRGNASSGGERMMRFGNLEIDRDARSVKIGGKTCALTGYQFDLLATLAENAGRVMSREVLMERLRGDELEAFDRSIDVHISRIRAEIEENPKHPQRIITMRGVGYLFVRDRNAG